MCSLLIYYSSDSCSTAYRILPSDFDFYYAKAEEIADRAYYTRENDSAWAVRHIAA